LALVPSVVWGRRGGGIAVNLYVPGSARVHCSEGEVAIVSKTEYPLNGDILLEVRPVKPARFTLSLRVPGWCRRFVAGAGGRTWDGRPGSYLEIDREWSGTEVIRIQMDLTVRVISGAPSYPEWVAVERGPQVLAVDENLNGSDENLNPGADIWLAGLTTSAGGVLNLHDAATSLPPVWRGSQAYTVRGQAGNAALGRKPRDLVLVPISDAGQSGGEYRVWLLRP
jgi:DUF1680 family protein